MGNWLIAIRIKTLPAAISPVILGTALAFHDGNSNSFILFMTLLAAVLIQIGANFANDVYDFQKGTDRDDRLGPKRATQSGLITPEKMKQAMWRIFALAIFVGFYLAWVGGWPIVFIGLASIAAGIAYTGGPYPLGYHGWGDAFVFIFFGPIAVGGTYWVQAGVFSNDAVLAGVGIGALTTMILVANNMRDVDNDKVTGKNTLVVRMGLNFSRVEYVVLLILGLMTPIVGVVRFEWPVSSLLSHLTLLFAFSPMRVIMHSSDPRVLMSALPSTARTVGFYALLLSLGLLVG